MCGTKFYIYGGQVDGEFLDDLWCFDLSSRTLPFISTSIFLRCFEHIAFPKTFTDVCVVTVKDGRPRWENLSSPPNTKAPARRTGHVMVTYADKLYLCVVFEFTSSLRDTWSYLTYSPSRFGGTDGQFHYNDTWCYDTSLVITPTTSAWNDLQCIGYIPLPREGHAGALVDDVMYIFGGRGVDGKDLSDLAAFKISSKPTFLCIWTVSKSRLSIEFRNRSTMVYVPKHGPCSFRTVRTLYGLCRI